MLLLANRILEYIACDFVSCYQILIRAICFKSDRSPFFKHGKCKQNTIFSANITPF